MLGNVCAYLTTTIEIDSLSAFSFFPVRIIHPSVSFADIAN